MTNFYIQNRLTIESKLRLFQQLHQSELTLDWRRASGGVLCDLCGLPYRKHPIEGTTDIDHRLCNGELVHL